MNICFNGCSFTEGEGFAEDQRDLYIYDRLLEKQFSFTRTNISVGGSSNYQIFMRSAEAIMSGQYHCVLTQWTALNRLWLFPGPDAKFFVNDMQFSEFRYRDIYLNAAEKTKLKNTLLILNHDFHNIIDLIKYTNILKKLAKDNLTKILFVNGMVLWTDDLVKPLNKNLSISLSAYSKKILDFNTRDDEEIKKFFTMLQHYAHQIDQSLWVNLWNPWVKNILDIGPLGHHPGIKSHQWMANLITDYFSANKLL